MVYLIIKLEIVMGEYNFFVNLFNASPSMVVVGSDSSLWLGVLIREVGKPISDVCSSVLNHYICLIPYLHF